MHGHECWRKEHYRSNRKDFNVLVLLDIDQAEECILEVFQPVEIES
jgi:hypothetical protein